MLFAGSPAILFLSAACFNHLKKAPNGAFFQAFGKAMAISRSLSCSGWVASPRSILTA
jgi:hypothetical protein